ncbi:hypothetical protein [Bradyrhizobium sp.]
MLRQSILGLGVAAAVCMAAASAHARYADYMVLSCSVEAEPRSPSSQPWFNAVAMSYRIDLKASAVNGETVQIERRDVNGPKLLWDRPAGASVPTTHYVFDLGTGRLFVSVDRFEHDGRTFAAAARRLRCTDRLLKIAV